MRNGIEVAGLRVLQQSDGKQRAVLPILRCASRRKRKIMSSFNMQRFHATGQVFEIDPVCEMKVDLQNPPFKILYKGRTYYFCSEVCRHLFERVPEKYIKVNET
jgi:YHS domain-containing protein